MKVTLRIWLAALIIQPVLFSFSMGKDALVIIPFELVGSLPGIAAFGLILDKISTMGLLLPVKWMMASIAAVIIAAFCSVIVIIFFGMPINGESVRLLVPAPIAAFVALLINIIAVNKKLKNKPVRITDPESAILNI